MERNGRLRDAELLRDLVRPQTTREHPAHQQRRRTRRGPRLRFVALRRGRRIEQRCQLVHLQEGPARLGDVDLHPASAGGVVVDLAVLDRLVQDRRQRRDDVPQRARIQRPQLSAVLIAQVRAGLQRLGDFAGLLQLARLERLAEVAVDPVQAVRSEERHQVREPPAVVDLRVLRDRSRTELATDLRRNPPVRVLAERLRTRRGQLDRLRRRRLPDPDADLRLDVPQLGPCRWRIPAATAAAGAAHDLVQHDSHPLTAIPHAQMKRPRAVGQRMCMDRALQRRSHSDPSALRFSCIVLRSRARSARPLDCSLLRT